MNTHTLVGSAEIIVMEGLRNFSRSFSFLQHLYDWEKLHQKRDMDLWPHPFSSLSPLTCFLSNLLEFVREGSTCRRFLIPFHPLKPDIRRKNRKIAIFKAAFKGHKFHSVAQKLNSNLCPCSSFSCVESTKVHDSLLVSE